LVVGPTTGSVSAGKTTGRTGSRGAAGTTAGAMTTVELVKLFRVVAARP